MSEYSFNTPHYTTIAVSKTQSHSAILEIYNQGCRNFGENYVQEALAKIPRLPTDIVWHFIGSIQSNKTLDIAKNFSVIHTIDREKIALRFDNHAQELGKKLQVLIQVNVDNEPTKSGVLLENLPQLVDVIKQLQHIELIGLMCIPQKNNTQAFAAMQHLQKQFALPELSMGMSGDYQEALGCGATMIRIGTAIFGKRQ
jgi:pyridoxal phosphate enzyme (YggS family)